MKLHRPGNYHLNQIVLLIALGVDIYGAGPYSWTIDPVGFMNPGFDFSTSIWAAEVSFIKDVKVSDIYGNYAMFPKYTYTVQRLSEDLTFRTHYGEQMITDPEESKYCAWLDKTTWADFDTDSEPELMVDVCALLNKMYALTGKAASLGNEAAARRGDDVIKRIINACEDFVELSGAIRFNVRNGGYFLHME